MMPPDRLSGPPQAGRQVVTTQGLFSVPGPLFLGANPVRLYDSP